MEKTEVRYCASVARKLLLANLLSDRPAWNRAWDQVAGSEIYGQLTAYMICRADREECGLGGVAWKSTSTIVLAGLRKSQATDDAVDLYQGAELLDHCHVENAWRDAWSKVQIDPDGLWMVCRIVHLVCRMEAGSDTAGQRMALDAITHLYTWRRPCARIRCEFRIARSRARWAWHTLRKHLGREPFHPDLVFKPVSRRNYLRRPVLPEFGHLTFDE